jgi:SAM-dependent methyltransferase
VSYYDDLDGYFGEDYVRFHVPTINHKRTVDDVDLIVELLGLRPSDRILDAPCGQGRISNELAARGYYVVGLDQSAQLLDLAKNTAPLAAAPRYIRADLRSMELSEKFDVSLSWYTSFGYFDDATDRDILRRYRRTLVSGGRLLIDIQSIFRVASRLIPAGGENVTIDGDGDDFMVDSVSFDAIASRLIGSRLTVSGEARRRQRYGHRYFTAPELEQWLVEAGFNAVDFYDENGLQFNLLSRRMIAVALA